MYHIKGTEGGILDVQEATLLRVVRELEGMSPDKRKSLLSEGKVDALHSVAKILVQPDGKMKTIKECLTEM